MEIAVSHKFLIVSLAFILFDVLVGLCKAGSLGNISSGKMRGGLYHKLGSVVSLVLAVAVEYSGNFIGNELFSFPLVIPVALYIILMEITSIIENIVVINPELNNGAFFKLFSDLKLKKEKLDDEGEAQ